MNTIYGILAAIALAVIIVILYLRLTADTRAVQNAKAFANKVRAVATANPEFKPIADAAENVANELEHALEDLKAVRASGDTSKISEAQNDFDKSSEKAKNVERATDFAIEALNSAAEAAKAAEIVEEAAEANPTNGALAELKRDSAGAARTAKDAAKEAILAAAEAEMDSAQSSAESAKNAAKSAVSMTESIGALAPKPPEKTETVDFKQMFAGIKPYWKWIVAAIVILALGVLISVWAPTGTQSQTPSELAKRGVPPYAEFNNGSSAWIEEYGNTTFGVNARPDGRAYVSGKRAGEDAIVVDFYACSGEKEVCDKLRESFFSEENQKRNDELLKILMARQANITK